MDVIVHKFKKTGARILFGAEKYCWPDETVEHLYPNVEKGLPKYLNSGLFIGEFFSFSTEMMKIFVSSSHFSIFYS